MEKRSRSAARASPNVVLRTVLLFMFVSPSLWENDAASW